MYTKWLIVALIAFTTFLSVGCASSRRNGYRTYDPYYDGVYRERRIYTPRSRDYYRWEQQRQREEWRRRQLNEQRRNHRRHHRDRSR